jgi:uncharacterized protein YjbI with pentapeptide repeats
MRIVTDSKVNVSWSVGLIKGQGLMLSVAIKGGFLLNLDSPTLILPEPPECSGDLYSGGEASKNELVYPSDFVPFKPRADILFIGAAHAPSEQSVTHLEVAVRVGELKKALFVVGDRSWQRRFLLWSRTSNATTFKSMPIAYQRSYGGGKSKTNPVGLGYDKKRLPNIESRDYPIRKRRDRPLPAGFGPIAPDWEPRRSKVGTYKGNWLKERWPWSPDDFDWSFFNAAPDDQQVENYLRGDEELEFQNLHPKYPTYRSRLPGLRARAFVQIELPDTEPEFREVKMNLDTLWIDMESEKLILVWRGLTPVCSVKFKEVTHLAALTEQLASPVRPKEEMREWMHQKIQEERGEGPPSPQEAAEAAVAKASQQSFNKEMAAMDNEEAELEKEFAGLEEQAKQHVEQEKARLIAQGIDPKLLEQPPKPQIVAEMKAQLASEVARLSEIDPQAAAKLADVEKQLDELETMEKEFAPLETEDVPPPSPESVQAAVAQGKPLTGADLSGLDFANKDLSGADFSGADFSNANLSNAKLVKCMLALVDFSEADLTGADFTEAVLDGADFSEAKLQGAKFPGTSIEGASFSEQQLQGVDFSDSKGRHPDLSSSNLEGANFARAKLPQADFCRSNVKAANFAQAELASADFGGASAVGINMEKADLTNLRAAEKSNFTGGKFREAKAPTSIWEGAIVDQADFTCAVLTGALFEEASAKETRFDRADLTKAAFDDAHAQKAILTNANLLRASFNRANLTEASLAGSNLYEASFWETVFHHTNIDGANVKRTSLA